MSVEPDALAVVNQLRDLASDPLNRRAIVQDQGCLPGLILFLDHPNPPVVYSALLEERETTGQPRQGREVAKISASMLFGSSILSRMPGQQRKDEKRIGNDVELAKRHSESRRSLCEDALLKIKGVISFTFQMAVQRCVVRIRSDLKAEALATAIASTKVMKAQQVVKGETGEELLVAFQDTSVDVEQNTDLPDYLPEDESPMKEQDKAVSRVGAHQDGGSSWLSTAANFLSRSFYW
ncbi:armadillo repeat-containing protein 1 isoform X2 [Rhinoderma darwinii]|uniref:armadillo repeat-containing protein 1 isoform X2 n=1 Tax=Rhinoderma darwinii TaxID=43563 RepID=UPI003F669783